MAPDNASSRPPAIRGIRRRPPPRPPNRSYRFAFRVIGIPILAVVGVVIYRGLRDRLTLPSCDSSRAKATLSQVLGQLKFQPTAYEPIKTVSSDKTEVVCNAVLPLSGGGSIVADYSFYWKDHRVDMKYSISRKAAGSPAVEVPARSAN